MKQIKVIAATFALGFITFGIQAQNHKKIQKEVNVEIVNGEHNLTIKTTENGETTTEVYTGEEAKKKMEELHNEHKGGTMHEEDEDVIIEKRIEIDTDEDGTNDFEFELKNVEEDLGKIHEMLEEMDIDVDLNGSKMVIQIGDETHNVDIGEELDKADEHIKMLLSDEEGSLDVDALLERLMNKVGTWDEEEGTTMKFIDEEGNEHTIDTKGDVQHRTMIIKNENSDEEGENKFETRVEVIMITRTVELEDDKSLARDLDVQNFQVYPNPNDGRFNVSFDLDSKKKTMIRATDVTGREVFADEIKKFDGHYTNEIDLRDQPAGTYFIKVQQGKKLTTKKVLVN